jgi:hypothetical protein
MGWVCALWMTAFLVQDLRFAGDRDSAIREGVKFLLDRQAADGSWGAESAFGQDGNIRSAITLFCIRALEATGRDGEEEREAVRRGIGYVMAHAHPRPRAASYGMYDFSFYSASYAIAYLSRVKTAEAREAIGRCLDTLRSNQREDGGFTYLFPGRRDNYEGFTTALVLLNNLEAAKNGVEIPADINRRALAALQKTRTHEGYFCYHMIEGKQRGSVSGNGKLCVEGSLVRTIVCEYALVRVGEGKKEGLKAAVENFFTHRQGLEDVRKRDRKTHQGPFDNAPYYFLFGHFYAAAALDELDRAFRAERAKKLEEIFMSIRERDGTWLDGRITGKDYGVAMALLTLHRLQRTDEY